MAEKLAISVRLMTRRDVKSVAKVEIETFGSWTERDFENTTTKRNVHAYIAEVTDFIGENVVGFVILEIRKFEMKVLNMAATWPQARKRLIVKANEFAERHNLHLVWENEQ